MAHALENEELDYIAEKLADELIEKRKALWVDPETHYKHHEWVASKIDDEKNRKELVNKIIQAHVLLVIPIIVFWTLSVFWDAIVDAIRAAIQ